MGSLRRLTLLLLILFLWGGQVASAQPKRRCVEGFEDDFDALAKSMATQWQCYGPLAFLTARQEQEFAEQPSRAPSSEVYVVQPGDTLYSIALRYGTNVATLAAANGLANPSLIYVGQRLAIPGSTTVSELSPPLISIAFSPHSVGQGSTVFIKVETEGEAVLSGSLDGRPLTFFGNGGEYWTVVGFPPWASLGAYTWSFQARDAQGRTGTAAGTVLVTDVDFPIDYIDLPPDREGLLAPEITVPERDRLAQIFSQVSPQPLWDGIFRLPVSGRKSSFFGEGRSYDGGPVASYHLGVDYSADEGVPVFAANSGRVVLAETLMVRGNTVAIDHGLGVYSGYFHLSSIAVSMGQEVEKGDLIGYVGSTGLATGPHLHWEMRVGDIPVDPEEWTVRSFSP